LRSIGLVIDSEELIELIVNGMEKFATGRVPVLKRAVCVNGNQYVLSYTWRGGWSPSNLSDGHGLLHVGVQRVAEFSCEYIEDFNASVPLA